MRAGDAAFSGTDIGLLTLGDSMPTWPVRSEFSETQPQISPDGRWLAYVSNRSGAMEVYVEALEGGGGRERVSRSGGQSPRWARDGRTLYYVRPATSGGTLVAARVEPGDGFDVVSQEDLQALDYQTLAGINYDVGPDGEIVFPRSRGDGRRQLIWVFGWTQLVED